MLQPKRIAVLDGIFEVCRDIPCVQPPIGELVALYREMIRIVNVQADITAVVCECIVNLPVTFSPAGRTGGFKPNIFGMILELKFGGIVLVRDDGNGVDCAAFRIRAHKPSVNRRKDGQNDITINAIGL